MIWKAGSVQFPSCPLDGAVTIEILYSLPVHPVHLEACFLGQVTGLHYRSRSVDVRQPQDMADLMNCHLKGINQYYYFSEWFGTQILRHTYFEKADAAATIGSSEVFVIIKVDITQEPRVGKFLPSAIKPLIATQMPSCVEYVFKTEALISV